jgi:hypothetical protein
MAGIALDIAHVVLSYDLGESGWLGEVGFVAARTKHRRVRKLGNHGGRVGSVFRQRTMARLAINAGMLADLLHFQNVGVTVFAGCVSREPWITGRKFFEGIGAVVSIEPETLGNELGSGDEKKTNADEKDCRDPEKMLCVLKLGQDMILEVPSNIGFLGGTTRGSSEYFIHGQGLGDMSHGPR